MQIIQISGVAGGGKTSFQIDRIADLIRSGIAPEQIGSSTFTREGRRTMVKRTVQAFGLDPGQLTDTGWFRTMHATARKCLGVGMHQLLTDSPESTRWLSEVFGVEVTGKTSVNAETGFPEASSSQNLIDDVIGWWSFVRNTLSAPFACIGRWPNLATLGASKLWQLVEKYEQHKRLDGRLDFCDLILRFIGCRIDRTGPEKQTPGGTLPEVAAWFFDEYQDSSAAIHLAAKRLASAPSVEYVFVGGDPYQSLYSFCGGDHRFLMYQRYWSFTHRQRLHHSYRCARAIIRCSEDTLSGCSDYQDRGVSARDDDSGRIASFTGSAEDLAKIVDPLQGSWLVLARTNRQAERIGQVLADYGLPWNSTRGGSYLSEPRRTAAEAILSLQAGQHTTPGGWRAVLRTLPEPLKADLLNAPATQAALDTSRSLPNPITRDNVQHHGASSRFLPWVDSLNWDQTDIHYARFVRAVNRYGWEQAAHPTTRVGTIHSVKGDEADNVLIYDALSRNCQRNLRIGGDEERRVWYVGITRARQSVTFGRLASDRCAVFR